MDLSDPGRCPPGMGVSVFVSGNAAAIGWYGLPVADAFNCRSALYDIGSSSDFASAGDDR